MFSWVAGLAAMRERRFGDEIVREPVRQLGERIRGQRRHDQQVGVCQVNVEVRAWGPPGQGEEGLGPDEALRAGSHQGEDLVSTLHEQANQVAGLVGGDSTGDSDQHSSHAGILPFRQRRQQIGEETTSGTCT